ncbi:para-nitrobenzyl esterase [Cordyceps militaris CM01]|uniref:Carboxylic ester hydrolase n=1 Tax=Cordyceps militaris (strain CM01) TaxID=983644 RepID=G3J2V6_CORMM|nr:para-nitrobenzyl esterase [Cordyceps militaris CM01]EGX97235.1 para-nitrobenzyl esterase [Cordyceps militaris CM01]
MVQTSLAAIVSSALLGSIGGFDSGSANRSAVEAPVAHLTNIGHYQSFRLSESISGLDLPHPVDAWLGIDYALQPVGERRFTPLDSPPARFDGIRDATRFGPVCTQDKADGHGGAGQSEACLNFNVYRPAGIPMTQKLPTLVWIHGGAFSLYSGRTMDGGSFVASSAQPVMVVTFNYRLNSLGFLPSRLFERLGLLNLGLRDQHFFLRFLQTHLPAFGGDTEQVTLGGLSAGAHSAAFAHCHNYGEDQDAPLFARVLLQSGAATARAFPDVRYPRYESDFEELMQHVGCRVDEADEEQIRCLRQAPIDKMEEISSRIYAEAESKLNWPWQPVLGGPRLEQPGSQCYQEGSFYEVPIITTHTTDEGKYYTPGHLETNDDFVRFWQHLSPHLNVTDLAILNELYPDPVAHPDSVWAQSPNSTQYNRVSGAWSDMAYMCPSRATASATAGRGVPTWRLRFNTPGHPLEAHGWRGIPHASDAAYFWNEAAVPFPDVARTYHAYMASFVAAGDPNRFRRQGAPEWPAYDGGACPRQLSVSPGAVRAECDGLRKRQCAFWNDGERAQRLNK